MRIAKLCLVTDSLPTGWLPKKQRVCRDVVGYPINRLGSGILIEIYVVISCNMMHVTLEMRHIQKKKVQD